MMRVIMGTLVLALAACGSEQPQREAEAPKAAAAVSTPAQAAVPVQAAMMAIPDDPEAVKRLQAMGYTVHSEENHLHAPGVKGCPAMADGPVM